MKITTCLFLIFCLGLATAAPFLEAEYQHMFTKWMSQYEKNYDMEAFFQRYSIFKENLNWIAENNAKNLTYTVGLNKFADLTSKEFAGKNGLIKSSTPPLETAPSHLESKVGGGYPNDFDWRTDGAVLIPRDQGQCGSCYAFSAVAAAESHWGIQRGMMYGLSEQELVDCSQSEGNQGCVGGQPDNSLHYMIKHGIAKKGIYPYTGSVGGCQSSLARSPVQIRAIQGLGLNNEAGMLAAVNIGPLIIQVAAGEKVFQFYTGGVLDDTACGTTIDHAVNVIGYGTASGVPYWTVRNSWGTGWGESGYIRIVRNKNMCQVGYIPAYPLVV